jgi:Mrp family chromosome partitioning ATPase/uncharacterized protein involved in exopolysaccharide biosynthesis
MQDAAPGQGRGVLVNSLVPRVRSRAIIGAVVDSLGLQLRPVPFLSLARLPVLPEIQLKNVRLWPGARADTLMLLFLTEHLIVRHGQDSKPAAYGKPIIAGAARFTVPKAPAVAGALLAVIPRDLAIDRLLTGLAVVPLTGTDALEVRYLDTDPRLAQAVTNQVVRTFHASTIDSSQKQAHRLRIYLEAQLEETERQLSQAQAGVSGFRSRQLASSSGKLARQQSALMNLDARRGELEADRRVFRSLLSRLETADDSARTEKLYTMAYSPEVATDPIVSKVFQRLWSYATRLDSLTSGAYHRLPMHPDLLQLRQMVSSSEGDLVRALRGRLTSIEERLKALRYFRTRSAEELATLPLLEAEAERLGQKVSALAKFADQLRSEHQKAQMSEALAESDIEIVDFATLPYLPTGIPWWLKVTLALVWGLALGTLLSHVLEMKNHSIRAPEELEEVLHLRGLGIIPPVTEAIAAEEARVVGPAAGTENGQLRLGRRGVVNDSLMWPSVGAEAFRLLYSRLTYGWGDRQRTILVTSAAPQEGKTLVAANLGVTFAREGARVLLIDCDLRRPRLHNVFRITRAPGLVELLQPASPLDEAVDGAQPLEHAYSMIPDIARPDDHEPVESNDQSGAPIDGKGQAPAMAARLNRQRSARFRNIRETSTRGLSLLPCGAVNRKTGETLKAGPFGSLLTEVSNDFDVIILDTPPTLVSADAVILAPVADDVLLVVLAGHTDRDAAERAHQQLSAAGGNVVGAVLNDPEGKVARDRMLHYADGYPMTMD